MRVTNVSLNANILPAVKERQVQWTTYANLLAWFETFRTFLIEFDFAQVGSNRELDNDEQLHRILNVTKTKIPINGSQTRACGRLAMTFHNPHLQLMSRAEAKSSLACTEVFGSYAAGKCKPPYWQLPTS
jgi:hypothetical protein